MPIDPESIQRFRDAYPDWHPEFKGMPENELRSYIREATGLEFGAEKVPSRPYQLEGLASALYKRRSFLFYGVRMGKTKIALNWMDCLRRAGKAKRKGLVIAHKPIALQVWKGEAEKHTDLKLAPVSSGKDAGDRLVDALESDADAVVLAWSTIQELFTIKKKSRKGSMKLYPDLALIRMVAVYFDHVVVDETHMCQEPTSLRFNIGAALLEECLDWRLGLTGTPMGRDPFSIWAQAYLIDAGDTFGRNYYFFEQAYGMKKESRFSRKTMKRLNRKGEEISVGYEWKFDESLSQSFQRKLSAMSISYEMSEVQTINILSSRVDLQMHPDQRDAYNDVVDKFIRLDRDNTIEVRATFVRMRQVASGFLPFTAGDGDKMQLEFKNTPKLEWLQALFEEFPEGIQGVIFHEFTKSGRDICAVAKAAKRTHSWLYGGSTEKEAAEALRSFQAGESQFLIANHSKGGTGIDLPMADWLGFYESPVSPTIRTQAAGRPLARGERPLLMDDLVCAPVEARILEFIAEGQDMLSQFVFRDRAEAGRKLRA